ncbi:putative phosphoesterase [Cognatiyoonia koreensis]|uniref:Putative phosphoesterase n=1 Tax=Cognatiyoonia koreensis TaxID=364200 RepID=A0A1I0MP41_9RHOB|nr:ligase-associated DNA damage response endonuclease PdeM [Cognatiyoonia koreensis]SEV89465.1 putative phosphoesterase [Cognatiyoonia koreensis]
MNGAYDFSFCDLTLTALPQGALWVGDHRALCVSDLHLGKSDRIARRSGRMLPPYETRATLEKLDALIAVLDPGMVICLGDSFDDLDAAQSLSDTDHLHMATLQAGRDWVWIEGNHDPGPVNLSGRHLAELTLGPLAFRHIATQEKGEISGHYHPKCGLAGGGTRPAFLIDTDRIIMPAFGTYTGGLRANHPALRALMSPQAHAVLTGRKAMAVPLKAVV